MKILVVDDDPVMLLAMKRMLSSMEGVGLVECFSNATEALDFVRKRDVDLAILDIMIAEDNGLELARSLRLMRADLDIIFTTSHSDYALPAYDVYPLDYIVKPVSEVRLAQSISRAVHSRIASSAIAGPTEEEVPTIDTPLTLRELEVLRGIASGWSNEEIAEQLQISLSTVKVHTRHVFDKLDVRNRVSAVTEAQRLGLLDGNI